MDIDKEEFDYIFADIKERYLSSINFPKLIIGTGLSIAMNIPGMSKLAKKLNKTFESVNDLDLKNLWNKYKTKIDDEGL